MLQAVGVLRAQFEECFPLLRNGDRRDDATELLYVRGRLRANRRKRVGSDRDYLRQNDDEPIIFTAQ